MPRSLFSSLRRRFGTPSSGAERREQVHTLYQAVKDQVETFHAEGYKLESSIPGARPQVLIIGAGFAGLSAGYHLAQKGLQPTILESRDRVGGRVHSLRNLANGQTIEGGAELIGTNHQLWMKLAIRFGLSFDAVTSDDLFNGAGLHEPFTINGQDIPSEDAKKLHDWMDHLTDGLIELSHPIDYRCPWLSPNAGALDKTSLADWLDNAIHDLRLRTPNSTLLRKALELEFGNNNGVPTNRQSLLAFLAMIKGGGGKKYWDMSEVFRCGEGNDALAGALQKSITDSGGSVLLNTAVTEIDIQPAGVTVRAITPAGTMQEYKADAIVLAIPPSVWDKIRMDPQIAAVHASQMGVAVKQLTVLDSRFWVKLSKAPTGSIDQIGMLWEGTDNQSLDSGKQIELTVFAGGETASHLLQMADPVREAFYADQLDGFYKSEFTAHKKISKFMSWPTEAWTMAGYSFPNVGEVCTKIRALNAVYNHRLVFAGEHTCLAFVGYMEGALQSGLHAAMKVNRMSFKDY
jgi:monoamine oxidase